MPPWNDDDLTSMVYDTSINGTKKRENGCVPWKHLCTIYGYHDSTIFSIGCRKYILSFQNHIFDLNTSSFNGEH